METMASVKAGLIQMGLKGNVEQTPDELREQMLAAHVPFIEEAGRKGVQVLCFQEVFDQPYFCPSRDPKWFAAAEKIPDGPSTQFMRTHAKKLGMVIVVPIFEIDDGVYYNTASVLGPDGKYLGKYRKNHIRNTPNGAERFYFTPGNMGYPVFDTPYCKLGVYICHDRHFPEGWRSLALNGAQYIVNPSATPEQMSRAMWDVEQRCAALNNCVFIGATNRVGVEPWDFGAFYGSSFFVDPRGETLVQASEHNDELIVADLELDLIEEMRQKWSYFQTRRPDTYGEVVHGSVVNKPVTHHAST